MQSRTRALAPRDQERGVRERFLYILYFMYIIAV